MKVIKERFELIAKALTPPTADEVCEALGKHLNRTVKIDTNMTFYYTEERQHYEELEKELKNAKRLIVLLRGKIEYDDGFETAFVKKEQLPNETYSQTFKRLFNEYKELSKARIVTGKQSNV